MSPSRTVIMALIFFAFFVRAEEPKPKPRAARSVHLGYTIPAPDGAKPGADMFYNEATVEQSTNGTYFMACGFRSGYFGIQELKNKKIVIFSIWDPGKQNDPNSVKAEDRVKTIYQGDGVEISRFGGEGTGAKSIFAYDWKANETQRFLITTKIEGTATTFAAWFYLNDKKEWKHLASFQAVDRAINLNGLYSFIEDFRRDGKSVDEPRRARYGNGWVRTLDGQWRQLVKAKFTGDATQLDNNDAGVTTEGDFYLATGGDAKRSRELNSTIERTPKNSDLPNLPAFALMPKTSAP
ncbi:MAG TPA: DUF3472 domain-containing protein [Planctomycetota bacterium]|nr:DUF3472 domain-containing protein [Planctomycetota bacterium]